MRHYWALRTDQTRRDFICSELNEGRLRQGWGYRTDLDLENLASLRRKGAKFAKYQQDAWRGNRRLLPTEPDGMQVGDLVVFLNVPKHGLWSIARVTGGYRYEISDMLNSVSGTPDFGHIRDVELLTDERGVDPEREAASDALRRSTRPMFRMWRIDDHGEEIEHLARLARAARP